MVTPDRNLHRNCAHLAMSVGSAVAPGTAKNTPVTESVLADSSGDIRPSGSGASVAAYSRRGLKTTSQRERGKATAAPAGAKSVGDARSPGTAKSTPAKESPHAVSSGDARPSRIGATGTTKSRSAVLKISLHSACGKTVAKTVQARSLVGRWRSVRPTRKLYAFDEIGVAGGTATCWRVALVLASSKSAADGAAAALWALPLWRAAEERALATPLSKLRGKSGDALQELA